METNALAFTGHRPQSLPYSLDKMSEQVARLELNMYDEIQRFAILGTRKFYCGCALGADILFGELVARIRDENCPEMKLICCVPFPNQANSWPEKWHERYINLLNKADERIVLSDRYYNGCYHARNRFMVDSSGALLAVYDGKPVGGTAFTVNYALSRGLEVVIISPSGKLRRL